MIEDTKMYILVKNNKYIIERFASCQLSEAINECRKLANKYKDNIYTVYREERILTKVM